MPESEYDEVKQSLLVYVREIFEEIEEGLARSHEEKYALLEDLLENAADVDELKVAFSQWYGDYADDLELEYELEEIWDNAINVVSE